MQIWWAKKTSFKNINNKKIKLNKTFGNLLEEICFQRFYNYTNKLVYDI